MPNFHKDNRVYTDSLIQIAEGINDLVLRLNKSKIRFGPKKKINKARLLNALFLWFLRQCDAEQDRIVSEVIQLLYRHHESKERLEIDRLSVAPTVGRKRGSYSTGGTIVDGSGVSKDRVTVEDDTPHRRR